MTDAGGLQVFQEGEDGGWIDWYSDHGRCIDELREDELTTVRWEMAGRESE